ncbi:MAG: threonine aldolase, partial [Verrucomicrobia bacterium]|nr:threonine aldolase [Verrucomicrobiota bacterium]
MTTTSTAERYDFASDNTAGICPEAWAALTEANAAGALPSYGDDALTAQACELLRTTFETHCEVFFVFNGTAANSLALAALCRPFEAVVAHGQAHIEQDECGAPAFFSGGSGLILVHGPGGKVTPDDVARALHGRRELHSHKPGAISLTQSTELGAVYSPEELRALGDFARARGLRLHMDGARFANAAAALAPRGISPADLTWRAGIDVLTLGGTKNG